MGCAVIEGRRRGEKHSHHITHARTHLSRRLPGPAAAAVVVVVAAAMVVVVGRMDAAVVVVVVAGWCGIRAVRVCEEGVRWWVERVEGDWTEWGRRLWLWLRLRRRHRRSQSAACGVRPSVSPSLRVWYVPAWPVVKGRWCGGCGGEGSAAADTQSQPIRRWYETSTEEGGGRVRKWHTWSTRVVGIRTTGVPSLALALLLGYSRRHVACKRRCPPKGRRTALQPFPPRRPTPIESATHKRTHAPLGAAASRHTPPLLAPACLIFNSCVSYPYDACGVWAVGRTSATKKGASGRSMIAQ